MVIPDICDGVLPEGIHECTIDEAESVFGRFTKSDRRIKLTEKLRQFVEAVRRSEIAVAVVVDGSYVTAKEEPNDIDLIVVLRRDFDLGTELRPFEYNIQSKRVVRRTYGFDLRVALDKSVAYEEAIAFFSLVRNNDPEQKTSKARKGLLRIAI